MEIDAVRSDLGPVDQGIPVSALNGTIIRQPIINTTQAQIHCKAMDGQTVVLGGLISQKQNGFSPQSALGGRFAGDRTICSAMTGYPMNGMNY